MLGIGLLAGAAVISASTAGYLLVRSTLHRQIDDSLLAPSGAAVVAPPGAAVVAPPGAADLPITELCRPRQPPLDALPRLQIRLQRVAADGSTCQPDGGPALPVSPQDVAAARSGTGGGLRDVTSGGVHLRMRVVPVGQGFALQIARPLTEVDSALRQLAAFLLAGTAITSAAVIGLAILLARSLVRPVFALTEAAEHIAATEDLTVPIGVHGGDEVARLTVAFNRMIARLTASRQRQQQLVADASHELRTPLTSLRTTVELLARNHDQGRVLDAGIARRLYATITAQTGELTDLIEELSELARDQRPDPAAAPVQLDDVVVRAVERARLRAGSRPVDVAALAPCQVHGDAAALERAVVNLLDNAVKFSPAQSPVGVELRAADGYARVVVSDRGPGIDADDLPHVFDRFWRAPSSRGMPGSGLGLAIVQQTAQAHHGTVQLQRLGDGGGTVATLSIPTA